MEWLVGRPAGWLAGWLVAWLPQSRTDQHRSTLLLFLPTYVYHSLYICVKLVFGKCVCALRRKKKGQRGGDVLHVLAWRSDGGFRKEEIFQLALPSDQVEGWDAKFSFLSPPFFFWLRFAFFGRANVILIARLSALLCEFARHFFISFPREIADAEEGETSSRFLAPLACEFVRRNENFPFPPLPICSPFVRALIPRCLLYRRRLFLAREGFVSLSVHTGRKWTSGSFLATMCIPQLDIYYTRVYSRLLV